jgi:O-antigen ligase
MLWYGNQNQFFWLVATALLCSIALALEESIPLGIRVVSVVLAAAEAVLIVSGMTLSAIMMAAVGVWLFGAWLAQRRAMRVRVAFAAATVSAGIVALVAIVRYWHVIYIQGSLYVRIPQYTAAIRVGIQHFPLGMGIDAYPPSVHNFVLNYFVEIGIVGTAAFLALVLIWCRDVALRSLRYPFQIRPFEFAFIAIFGTYLLVISLQPIPVQRFWWVLFGASWAVAQDRLPNQIDSP